MGSHPSKRDRLRRIAEMLQPMRPPYYVGDPDRRHQAPGWYWIPDGLDTPAYLGHSAVTAEISLRALIEGHYRA